MTHKEGFIRVDGQKIKAELFLPDNSNAKNQAVLFLHGWTGRPNNKAATFLSENGYTALTLVFRGHPGSDSSMDVITRKNAIDDAIAGYDYLRSKISPDMPICVAGSSYGGYTAALLCAERHLNGASLRVAANYPDEGFELPQMGKGHDDPEVMRWRSTALDPMKTRSLRAINIFEGKVQILEAELDDMVPHQTLQNYVNAVKDKSQLEYHLMKGWPHSLGDHKERNKEYQELLINWLEKL